MSAPHTDNFSRIILRGLDEFFKNSSFEKFLGEKIDNHQKIIQSCYFFYTYTYMYMYVPGGGANNSELISTCYAIVVHNNRIALDHCGFSDGG